MCFPPNIKDLHCDLAHCPISLQLTHSLSYRPTNFTLILFAINYVRQLAGNLWDAVLQYPEANTHSQRGYANQKKGDFSNLIFS